MRAWSLVVAAFLVLSVAAKDAAAGADAGAGAVSPEAEAEAAISASADAKAKAEAQAVATAEALANQSPEEVAKSTAASLEAMLKRHSDAEKSVEDMKAAEHESAVAVSTQQELDKAMNAQLDKEMQHSKAESVARQAVFDSQHRAYQKVVSKLVEQLDAVLDGSEASVEGSDDRLEREKTQRKDHRRMLLTLQAECAARVQRVLSQVYDAADAVASGTHLRHKARYAQRTAFDKAIRAAKKASQPTIGFDMVNEIQKAVDAAREAWVGAAGVHIFDAAMAPAEARAEHLIALAEAQQRQCSMITLGDVQDLVKHQKTIAAALQRKATGADDLFEDEEEQDEEGTDEDEGEDEGEEGDDEANEDADEDADEDAPFPHDPCMWGITPSMSVADIANQITGCRQSRDAALYRRTAAPQFPAVYARTAASAYNGIQVPHVMQAYGHMASQQQWANAGLGAYTAQFGPYSQGMMAPNMAAYGAYGANPVPQFNAGGYAAYGSYAPTFNAANLPISQYGMYPPHPSVGPTSQDAANLAKQSPVPAGDGKKN